MYQSYLCKIVSLFISSSDLDLSSGLLFPHFRRRSSSSKIISQFLILFHLLREICGDLRVCVQPSRQKHLDKPGQCFLSSQLFVIVASSRSDHLFVAIQGCSCSVTNLCKAGRKLTNWVFPLPSPAVETSQWCLNTHYFLRVPIIIRLNIIIYVFNDDVSVNYL